MYRLRLRQRLLARASRLKKRTSSTTAGAEPFLSGSSGVYVEQMYEAWRKDPSSVHKVEGVLRGYGIFSPGNVFICIYVCIHLCIYMYIVNTL